MHIDCLPGAHRTSTIKTDTSHYDLWNARSPWLHSYKYQRGANNRAASKIDTPEAFAHVEPTHQQAHLRRQEPSPWQTVSISDVSFTPRHLPYLPNLPGGSLLQYKGSVPHLESESTFPINIPLDSVSTSQLCARRSTSQDQRRTMDLTEIGLKETIWIDPNGSRSPLTVDIVGMILC